MAIKLIDIDLTQPLQPIYVDARYARVFFCVRCHYQPLGLVQMNCETRPGIFSAEQLKKIFSERFSWNLWEEQVAGKLIWTGPGRDVQLPNISVIVCTRDRPIALERCLDALHQLDYQHYEVIVVDNCSQDQKVCEVVQQSGFRYVREDRPGLDWARNCGIEAAKNDIVAFIDDDALAFPWWLRGIAHGFEDTQVMAVTGLVLPAELETEAQNDFEIYGGMNKGFTGFTIHPSSMETTALFWASGWGVGTNMAYRRELFAKIGGFDVALDVGTPTNGGGDIEFFYRTVARGHSLRYEPAAMVRHFHRRDAASLNQQIYNNGRSFPAFLLTIAIQEPSKRVSVLSFCLKHWLYNWLLKRLVIGIVKRDRWKRRFAFYELRGAFSSLFAFNKSRKIAQQIQSSSKSTI